MIGERNRATLPPFLFGLVAVTWIAADRGGYYATSSSWTALAGLLIATFVLILSRSVALGRLDLLLVGGFAAFTGWTLASVAWSDSVPSTLDTATRCLAYLALVTVGLLLTRARTSSHLLGGVVTGATLICLYALATRLLPGRVGTFDSHAGGYRLSTPITYWNGLGIFAVMALLLSLTFAARSRRTSLRAVAAGMLPLLAATVYFTFSRGAWLALAVGLIVAVASDRNRLQLTAVAALLSVPTALAVWLSSGPGALRVLGSNLDSASTAGHHLLAELLAVAVLSAAIGAAAHVVAQRVEFPGLVRKGWGAFLVLAVVAGIAFAWVENGSPVHEARVVWADFHHAPKTGSANVGSRLFDLSSNGRLNLWRVGWRSFRSAPLAGHGGGTFWEAWAANPTHGFVAKDTHDLYLQTLSEVGAVGLAILLIGLLIPVAAALRTRARLTAGALAAYTAWLVHSAVDWDWQLVGVSAVAVLVGVALVARERTTDPRLSALRWPLAAASAVLAAAAFATVMANVSLDRASNAYAHGSLAAANHYARRAEAWNPWSAEPWDLRASIAARRGDGAAARKDMHAALERDPRNWQLQLRLALMSTGAAQKSAFEAAKRLDPHDVPEKIPASLVRKRPAGR